MPTSSEVVPIRPADIARVMVTVEARQPGTHAASDMVPHLMRIDRMPPAGGMVRTDGTIRNTVIVTRTAGPVSDTGEALMTTMPGCKVAPLPGRSHVVSVLVTTTRAADLASMGHMAPMTTRKAV